MARPRVVIIGGGFAGLNAAKQLRREPVEVLLIDQNNYHTFQPLLYQVATAGLETGDIAHQIRDIFRRQKNFRFRMATVTGVNWEAKEVILNEGEVAAFDYLLVAAGAVYNDFGIPGVKDYGFLLKSLTEAANIRSHILQQFELVSAEPERIAEGLLNFVIVGAGPTGVEMAGALVELFDRPFKSDYPELDLRQAKVILIEMADVVLLPYGEASRRYAEAVLRERGVEIRLGESVTEVTAGQVTLKSGETISTHTLIWAAGIRGHPLADVLNLELTRGYRIKVNADLTVPYHPHVFVAGDLAASEDAEGRLYPQVATVAIQQGKHVGKQIARLVKGKMTKPFRFFDKGNMAIIGRNAGIAELSRNLGGFRFEGLYGWLAWLFIHLIYLPGHQNRINALANWAYNYFTYDRHKRLITFLKPSPAEVANRTGKLVSPEKVAPAKRQARSADVSE
jgi:NADH:ubiquinone reductase (H+-translocating)